ncbi:GlcNAc-transferase family protein [Solwaraspora sp. WMMA2056]|uniref:GlcNAc-transferase family protein n=1 Tax=Solwaraspora sp. WMMA2056 TaxID=3015161 RepID=UPI00259BBBD6|nr:GlcNAc-transferase family protein [Solwaraspora sp. WMMA2056]WJK43725.1 GlcNAc-transferase family protein [Solwaraspora sp. WMMA2056]
MSIFVSVAAYRDPELVPTVLDCLAKADRPDELRVVVNWQHLGDEDVSPLRADPRVTVLEFDARHSRGVCWARAEIQRSYVDSDWYLQVDSHTRFAPGWDTRLVAMAERTGAAKPILSCYPPAYDPNLEFVGAGEPTLIFLTGWTDDGLPRFGHFRIPGWREATTPIRARFVAAGFLFAAGTLVRDVPYDRHIYCQGEEINLATRAFTWGYDLFHPVEVLAWHYYVRPDRVRHWMDHGGPGDDHWYAWDRAGRRRVATLLRYPMVGGFGSGPVRSMAAYQEYAGIDFRTRTGTPDAMLGRVPGPTLSPPPPAR